MKGALLIVARAGGPVWFGKWRDASGRQVKRRLGPAWVVRSDGGGWRPRRGRPMDGALDERSALLAMAAAIEQYDVLQLADQPARREPTFADAVERWMHHQEFVAGVKPSTLADYRYLLASPGTPARRRGRTPSCRIMRAFGPLPLASIAAADVGRYLASLDAEPSVGPRTVNKHRQVLCCVFGHAMREDTFALPVNPARRTDKRREPDTQPIDFYEPEEVLALVRAARAGLHRDPTRPAVSPEEHAERDRCDEQDAAIFVVAAFTGLRMGELLALRWRNVDFLDARLVVEASLSQSGRRDLLRKLKACARHLAAGSLKGAIRLDVGSNNVPPRILIERTPADLDTRGMPQAWQAQGRHMASDLGRSGGPPPEEDRQLSLDDLDLGEADE
jgi:integrase